MELLFNTLMSISRMNSKKALNSRKGLPGYCDIMDEPKTTRNDILSDLPFSSIRLTL